MIFSLTWTAKGSTMPSGESLNGLFFSAVCAHKQRLRGMALQCQQNSTCVKDEFLRIGIRTLRHCVRYPHGEIEGLQQKGPRRVLHEANIVQNFLDNSWQS